MKLHHKLKTFNIGGVHPDDQKLSAGIAISPLPLPKVVTIPIIQHIGAPAKIIVQRGDMVKTGQIVAIHEGFVSSNIHTSVSGRIGVIEEVMDSSGFKHIAISIRIKGDEWEESIDQTDTLVEEINLEPKEIVSRIMEAGVVGMGGAAFPSHVKLSVPEGKHVDYLLINGVECEPYLTADHRLMLEKPKEIIVGIKILMKALGVTKAIIGIEDNKHNAVELFKELLKNETGITVEALEVQYPQGGEKQLIQALLNREVPSGGLPSDVGVIVHNVGTTFAIYEAVQKNKPLIERVVTVTGKSVKQPSNFLVRIGTPVIDLLIAAGGVPEDTGKIVGGGPMMGKAIADLDVPIAKGTSGILLIPKEESTRAEIYNCVHCGKCIEACPMGLEPYHLLILSKKGNSQRAKEEHILDCIECGSCSFVCPSNRPILDYIRLGKTQIRKPKKA
ncbi:MAG TPA: electron transport complex subunit RsxC [Cyclobacteriaceae bacterium]|nr:electron transport complex subunit RsxC [Cyclobacteriaceae bacterium]